MNDDGTRTFLSLMVDCGFDQCSKLVGEVDDLFRSFDLPPFYEVRTLFHVFRALLLQVFTFVLKIYGPVVLLKVCSIEVRVFPRGLLLILALEWKSIARFQLSIVIALLLNI